MATNWMLYERLLGIENKNAGVREHAINDAVNSFLEGVMDDPAYVSDAKIDGITTPIVAARSSTVKCSIKASPKTNIQIGDMVECFGEIWIVVELYIDRIGIINGEMWLCNHEIKFQNGSPNIFTRHCVVDDGTYSKRSSDPDAFIMTNTYKVYMSIDDATKMLYVDKRIGFGEIYSSDGSKILEVYKIIGIDTKSKNYGSGSHLMVLTMQRDVYDKESDSIIHGICDMFNTSNADTTSTPNGSCFIDGRDSIRIGTSRLFEVLYVDSKGTRAEVTDTIWSVVAPDGVAYSVNENICTLTIPLDSNLVGESVTIVASDASGMYGSFEKKVQVITIG